VESTWIRATLDSASFPINIAIKLAFEENSVGDLGEAKVGDAALHESLVITSH
jgi:hypothetical protein